MATPPVKSQPRMVAAVACALAGAAVFQFFGNANHGYIVTDSLFWWWGYQWVNPDSETEHGWLILALSAWLFVRALRREGERPAGGDSAFPWAAVAAMAGGLALHTLGFVAQQARVSIVALLVFSWGVLRFGGGPRWGRAAAFPLAFLVFAIPLEVLDTLGFWLRLWVVEAGTAIAHGLGIDVVRSGTRLVAPDGRYQYDVAAACSGVRSLMALTALSLLIGYLRFRTGWRRGAVFLLSLPLVYVGNVARIVAIVLAAHWAGPASGDRAHAVMGYALFVIVLGGVLLGAALIERWAPEGEVSATTKPVETATAPAPVGAFAVVVAVVVGLLALTDVWFLRRISTQAPRGEVGVLLAADGRNPVDLPGFAGREWVGWPAAVTAVEREILPPDTGYSRINYVASRDARRVFLSIVLSGRDRTSIHRPELCLVGQGWTIDEQHMHRFEYPGGDGRDFPATVLRVHRKATAAGEATAAPQVVAYWFVAGDRVVAGHWARLAYDAWNRVAKGRADRWAYVLAQTDATDGEAEALRRIQTVLTATLPKFQRPMPPREVPSSK